MLRRWIELHVRAFEGLGECLRSVRQGGGGARSIIRALFSWQACAVVVVGLGATLATLTLLDSPDRKRNQLPEKTKKLIASEVEQLVPKMTPALGEFIAEANHLAAPDSDPEPEQLKQFAARLDEWRVRLESDLATIAQRIATGEEQDPQAVLDYLERAFREKASKVELPPTLSLAPGASAKRLFGSPRLRAVPPGNAEQALVNAIQKLLDKLAASTNLNQQQGLKTAIAALRAAGKNFDTTAPQVTIVLNPNQSAYNLADLQAGVQVTITVKDVLSGVDAATFSVTATTNPATIDLTAQTIVTYDAVTGILVGTLTLNATSMPDSAVVVLSASAGDLAGNLGSNSVSFMKDTMAPVINIAQPADGSTAASTQVSVSIVIDDALSTISTESVHVTLDGTPIVLTFTPVSETDGIHLTGTISATQGNRTLLVTADDSLGNHAAQMSSFTVTVPNIPPSIHIARPIDRTVVFSPGQTLIVQASDLDGGIIPSQVQVTLNGSPVTFTGLGNTPVPTFTASVPITAVLGANVVTAHITDTTGAPADATSKFHLVTADGPGQVSLQIQAIGGTDQPVYVVGQCSSEPLVVKVTGSEQPMTNLPVSFRVTSGRGKILDVTPGSQVTDNAGIAKAKVLFIEPGVVTIRASLSTAPSIDELGFAEFVLVAENPSIGLATEKFTTASQDPSGPPEVVTDVPGSAVRGLPAVQVADPQGNPLPCVEVCASLVDQNGVALQNPDSIASFVADSVVTGDDGMARFAMILSDSVPPGTFFKILLSVPAYRDETGAPPTVVQNALVTPANPDAFVSINSGQHQVAMPGQLAPQNLVCTIHAEKVLAADPPAPLVVQFSVHRGRGFIEQTAGSPVDGEILEVNEAGKPKVLQFTFQPTALPDTIAVKFTSPDETLPSLVGVLAFLGPPAGGEPQDVFACGPPWARAIRVNFKRDAFGYVQYNAQGEPILNPEGPPFVPIKDPEPCVRTAATLDALGQLVPGSARREFFVEAKIPTNVQNTSAVLKSKDRCGNALNIPNPVAQSEISVPLVAVDTKPGFKMVRTAAIVPTSGRAGTTVAAPTPIQSTSDGDAVVQVANGGSIVPFVSIPGPTPVLFKGGPVTTCTKKIVLVTIDGLRADVLMNNIGTAAGQAELSAFRRILGAEDVQQPFGPSAIPEEKGVLRRIETAYPAITQACLASLISGRNTAEGLYIGSELCVREGVGVKWFTSLSVQLNTGTPLPADFVKRRHFSFIAESTTRTFDMHSQLVELPNIIMQEILPAPGTPQDTIFGLHRTDDPEALRAHPFEGDSAAYFSPFGPLNNHNHHIFPDTIPLLDYAVRQILEHFGLLESWDNGEVFDDRTEQLWTDHYQTENCRSCRRFHPDLLAHVHYQGLDHSLHGDVDRDQVGEPHNRQTLVDAQHKYLKFLNGIVLQMFDEFDTDNGLANGVQPSEDAQDFIFIVSADHGMHASEKANAIGIGPTVDLLEHNGAGDLFDYDVLEPGEGAQTDDDPQGNYDVAPVYATAWAGFFAAFRGPDHVSENTWEAEGGQPKVPVYEDDIAPIATLFHKAATQGKAAFPNAEDDAEDGIESLKGKIDFVLVRKPVGTGSAAFDNKPYQLFTIVDGAEHLMPVDDLPNGPIASLAGGDAGLTGAFVKQAIGLLGSNKRTPDVLVFPKLRFKAGFGLEADQDMQEVDAAQSYYFSETGLAAAHGYRVNSDKWIPFLVGAPFADEKERVAIAEFTKNYLSTTGIADISKVRKFIEALHERF